MAEKTPDSPPVAEKTPDPFFSSDPLFLLRPLFLLWLSRVEKWRGSLGAAYLVLTLSVVSASRAVPCPVSTSPSSNRTCGFAASGSPTSCATRATDASDDAPFLGLASCFRNVRARDGVC